MKIATFGLVTALALGGLLAGARVASAQQTKAESKGEHHDLTPQQRVDKMDKALKLSDEQKGKLIPFFEGLDKKMHQAESTASGEKREREYDAIWKTTFEKMKEVLTPEQFKKWEKIEDQRRRAEAAAEKKEHEK